MPYIQGKGRSQGTLFPVMLNDSVHARSLRMSGTARH